MVSQNKNLAGLLGFAHMWESVDLEKKLRADVRIKNVLNYIATYKSEEKLSQNITTTTLTGHGSRVNENPTPI